MLVKNYMTRHPLMVQPTMPIVEAQRFMGENKIRHLPVVGDGKRLLGLVTRQTLLVDPGRLGSLDVWEIARTLTGLKLQDVMIKAKDVITIEQEATVEDAAQLMVDRKIGGLPVLEEGVVVGILTDTDLLAHLTELLGEHEPGVRAAFRAPERVPVMRSLVDAIAEKGWGLYASGYVRTPKLPDHWDYVCKIRHATEDGVVAVLEGLDGVTILDVRETD